MQSGLSKQKKWILEFDTRDTYENSLMGWEASDDTLGEIKLSFSSKNRAIDYAKSNNINYRVIEPKREVFVIKSYADNFTKN